jgi:hypothetical protein
MNNHYYNKNLQDDIILTNINFVIEIIKDKIEVLKKLHPPAPASGGD